MVDEESRFSYTGKSEVYHIFLMQRSLFFFLSVAMSTCLLRKKRRRWREKPYAIETATLAKSQKVLRNLSWLTRLDFLIPYIDAKRKIYTVLSRTKA